MALPLHAVVISVLIGLACGLRSLTPAAIVAWATCLRWLILAGSSLSFMGSTTAVILLTLAALAELIADKLPTIPNRTAPIGLITRFLTGALCGACLAASSDTYLLRCAVVGAIGRVGGAFVGYQARTRLVKILGVSDFVVALCEDVIAIGLAVLVVAHAS